VSLAIAPSKSVRAWREEESKRIGLAIIGAGRVGLFRGEVAARHPQVDFIGLADSSPSAPSWSRKRSAPISSPRTSASCSRGRR